MFEVSRGFCRVMNCGSTDIDSVILGAPSPFCWRLQPGCERVVTLIPYPVVFYVESHLSSPKLLRIPTFVGGTSRKIVLSPSNST